MDFSTLATTKRIQRTMEAIQERNISVELVQTKEEALGRLQVLIPAGAGVMTGGSLTLTQIGLDDILISGKHPWRNVKGEILAEKDAEKKAALRKQSTLTEFFLGSVNAITESGELVFGSNTGNQLAAYAYCSRNAIWVAGTQKIVPTLDDALRRVREYVLPLMNERLKDQGNAAGTFIGRFLIFEREPTSLKRNLHLILVNQVLGY